MSKGTNQGLVLVRIDLQKERLGAVGTGTVISLELVRKIMQLPVPPLAQRAYLEYLAGGVVTAGDCLESEITLAQMSRILRAPRESIARANRRLAAEGLIRRTGITQSRTEILRNPALSPAPPPSEESSRTKTLLAEKQDAPITHPKGEETQLLRARDEANRALANPTLSAGQRMEALERYHTWDRMLTQRTTGGQPPAERAQPAPRNSFTGKARRNPKTRSPARSLPVWILDRIRNRIASLPKISSPATLVDEIRYQLTSGVFRNKDVSHGCNICLKLIAEGRWRTPWGFEASASG